MFQARWRVLIARWSCDAKHSLCFYPRFHTKSTLTNCFIARFCNVSARFDLTPSEATLDHELLLYRQWHHCKISSCADVRRHERVRVMNCFCRKQISCCCSSSSSSSSCGATGYILWRDGGCGFCEGTRVADFVKRRGSQILWREENRGFWSGHFIGWARLDITYVVDTRVAVAVFRSYRPKISFGATQIAEYRTKISEWLMEFVRIYGQPTVSETNLLDASLR